MLEFLVSAASACAFMSIVFYAIATAIQIYMRSYLR